MIGDQLFVGRGRFFAAATAAAMGRILVENTSRDKRLKRGDERLRFELEADCSVAGDPGDGLLAVYSALIKMTAAQPAKSDLMKLRYRCDLTMPEIA